MQKLTFKERVWKEREQVILNEAGRLMREHGFEKLNMDKVAEAVGIAKPTLYQHFKSKDELATQVMLRGMEHLEAYLLTPHSGSPREQLADVMRMVLRARHAPDGMMFGLAPELIVALIHHDPIIRVCKNRINALLGQIIETGKANGEITDELETQEIIGWLFCTSSILKIAYPDNNDAFWDDHLDPNINRIVRRFLLGIST
jgi:TetR/AcrR family transcriptional regulator, cholesterol catabolism regulator